MIFTLQHTTADMQAFYGDIKGRVVASGRRPEECAILPSLDPIIGETESIAREKHAYVNELVDSELALALVSAHGSGRSADRGLELEAIAGIGRDRSAPGPGPRPVAVRTKRREVKGERASSTRGRGSPT